MKIKQLRSILAVAVVAASITTSLSPAQAFTWEDLWNSVKRGYENAPSSNSSQQSNGAANEAPQSAGFNDSPQPQTAPQQNNYSAPSSPTPPSRRPNRALQDSCVKASGYDAIGIGRDDSDSIVSVGQRAIRVDAKVSIYDNSPHGATCAITVHPSSEKVALAFAIPDNSGLDSVRVSIYVNGQERISKIMSRGQARRYVFDITGASSYAYILQPTNNAGGDIYFPQIRQPRRQPN